MNKREDLEMMDALVLLVLVTDKPCTINLVANKVEEVSKIENIDVYVHPKRVRSCIDEHERLGLVRWTRMRHPETDRDRIIDYASKRLHFPLTGGVYKRIYTILRKSMMQERYGAAGELITEIFTAEVKNERR